MPSCLRRCRRRIDVSEKEEGKQGRGLTKQIIKEEARKQADFLQRGGMVRETRPHYPVRLYGWTQGHERQRRGSGRRFETNQEFKRRGGRLRIVTRAL